MTIDRILKKIGEECEGKWQGSTDQRKRVECRASFNCYYKRCYKDKPYCSYGKLEEDNHEMSIL